MVRRTLLVALLLGFGCSGNRQPVYKLYYLGGQSNMDGFGYVSELSDSLNRIVEDVYIFHGNTGQDNSPVQGQGIWAPLGPGHGTGIKSDSLQNDYSERFGLELMFGRRMRELDPDSPIAIIKYSKGGTSIDSAAARYFGCWEPDFKGINGVNQWDHFLATVANALDNPDFNGDGLPDRYEPAGILWMQGESDAQVSLETAQRYEENLTRLIKLIRERLGDADLKAVIGRISESGRDTDGIVWDYGDIVRQAQADFVQKDVNAALVTSTDSYGYSDPWHYDTAGFLDLGRQFAEALHGLQ